MGHEFQTGPPKKIYSCLGEDGKVYTLVEEEIMGDWTEKYITVETFQIFVMESHRANLVTIYPSDPRFAPLLQMMVENYNKDNMNGEW